MAKITLSYPDTWLTIAISVKNRDTWVDVFSWNATEIAPRVYVYDFTELPNTDYIYTATVAGYSDMSGMIYQDGGGLTTTEHNHLLQLVNSTWGGWGFSSQAIQTSIHNTKTELIKKIEEIPQVSLENIENLINENNSQIELAKDEIIDRITENETNVRKDIWGTESDIKKDNIKTRNLVRQKIKKINENVSKLSDRQDLTDKMIEDEAKELEEEVNRILKEEVDMIETEIFTREADEIEKELNYNQNPDGNNS